MKAAALILGAGQGRRLGAHRPKALIRVAGRSLIAWSAEALGHAEGIDAVLCVVPPQTELRESLLASAEWLDPVVGGESRQASLARGLAALHAYRPDCEWVAVHDAARCMVEASDVDRVLDTARETGAAIPILPVVDTLKQVRDGVVVKTLVRSRLARVQTPQAFHMPLLREALDKAARESFLGTDCASLVERLGVRVRTCTGREGNWKVTGPGDLERAAAILSRRSALDAREAPGCEGRPAAEGAVGGKIR